MRATVARVAAVDDDIWKRRATRIRPLMLSTPEPRTTVAQPPPRRRRTWTLIGVGTALAASVLAFATFRGDDDPALRTVALSPVGDVPGWAATIEITPRDMHLVADGLPQLPPKTVYEAWLGRADGSMVSVGTFTVDTTGHVDGRMTLSVNPSDFSAVDVSVEPEDGNPAHSTRSVFHAAL